MEKSIYFWQLQKKDKIKADVWNTCDLTLLNCEIKEKKSNHISLCRKFNQYMFWRNMQLFILVNKQSLLPKEQETSSVGLILVQHPGEGGQALRRPAQEEGPDLTDSSTLTSLHLPGLAATPSSRGQADPSSHLNIIVGAQALGSGRGDVHIGAKLRAGAAPQLLLDPPELILKRKQWRKEEREIHQK